MCVYIYIYIYILHIYLSISLSLYIYIYIYIYMYMTRTHWGPSAHGSVSALGARVSALGRPCSHLLKYTA